MAHKTTGGGGYRKFEHGGFEILLGRSARDNDRLTLRIAAPHDLWLHAAGYAGSHVVIRNPAKGEVPRPILEAAAQLAAYHSKARGATGKVPVHVCPAGEVRKRPGAPPGQVMLKGGSTIRVYVRNPFPLEASTGEE
jgi:predicted ribosome quality control (RQC) complex YloA/Tae2 family protein